MDSTYAMCIFMGCAFTIQTRGQLPATILNCNQGALDACPRHREGPEDLVPGDETPSEPLAQKIRTCRQAPGLAVSWTQGGLSLLPSGGQAKLQNPRPGISAYLLDSWQDAPSLLFCTMACPRAGANINACRPLHPRQALQRT